MCDKTEPPYDCTTWHLPDIDQIVADDIARSLSYIEDTALLVQLDHGRTVANYRSIPCHLCDAILVQGITHQCRGNKRHCETCECRGRPRWDDPS
jgi:RNase P subunit RPR2